MADRSIKVKLEAEVSQYKKGLEGAAKATEALAAKAELAAKNVDVAAAKQKTAAAKVLDAERALKQARESGKSSATQLAAAEQKVAEAKRQDWRASQELKTANDALAKSGEAVAKAAKSQGTAFGRLESFVDRTGDSAQTAGAMLTAFGGAVTAIGAAALKTGIEYNTLQQSSRAALTTLLGSAEAANAQMEKLDAFAKTSPFAKSTFITAQQQMLAFGIEAQKVVPYMEAINDAVAAAGGSSQDFGEIAFVLSQIQAAGKLTATDLMQLGQRGVNAAELIGSQMGKTGAQIKNDISAGTLDATAALDALTAGMSQKFDGASDNVKNTMVGAFDRVKAAWRDLSSELAEGLVSKEGGGLLVDATNQVADIARGFQSMDGPVKVALVGLTGVAGAASLASGSFLLMAPRIVATRAAMAALSVEMPKTSKAVTALGKSAAAAIPLLTAVIGAATYDGGEATQGLNEIKAGIDALIEGAWAAETVFKNSGQGNWFTGQQESLKDLLADLTDDSALTKFSNGFADAMTGAAKALTFGTFDARATAQKQRDDLIAYGEELSRLAETDVVAAAHAFQSLNYEAGNTDASAAQLLQTMPALKDALVGVANEAGMATDDATLLDIALGRVAISSDEAGEAGKRAAPSYEDWAKALQKTADAADDAFSNLNKLSDSFLGQRAAERDFVDSTEKINKAIADAQKKFSDAELQKGKALDISTEAGRKNQEELDSYVKSARATVEASYAAGDSQDTIVKKMKAAREAVVNAAEGYGYSEKAAEAYADAAGLIPAEVRSTFAFDTTEALGRVSALETIIEGAGQSLDDWVIKADGTSAVNTADGAIMTIDKKTGKIQILGDNSGALSSAANAVQAINRSSATVSVKADTSWFYNATRNLSVPAVPVNIAAPKNAQGGRIGGLAGGGRLPRTGLGTDQILGVSKNGTPTAWVDDREWVINAKSSERFNGLLKMINENNPALSGLAGLAGGGRVGVLQGQLKSAKKTFSSVKSSVKSAQKAYDGIDGKKENRPAKRAAKSRLDSVKKDLVRAEKAVEALKSEIKDLKAVRSDLSSGAAEKNYTYNERTGKVEASNSLIDSGTSGLSGAYGLVAQAKAMSKLDGLTKKQSSAIANAAKTAKKEFESLYKTSEKLEGKLAKAEGHLSDLRGVASGVKSGLVQGFGLGDSVKDATEDRYVGGLRVEKAKPRSVSGSSLVSAAKAYKSKLSKFSTAIKKLAGWGASSTILQEIAGYGVEDGLLIANSLSKNQVKELNGLYSSISSLSGLIGNQSTRNYTAADGTVFKNGVYDAKQDVLDIRSAVSANDKALKNQTDKLLDQMAKPLNLTYDKKTGKLTAITPKKKATGGFVYGPGSSMSDSIPTMLSNGEFVTRAAVAQKPANAAVLTAMNSGRSVSVGAQIDYVRLGEAVAAAMRGAPVQVESKIVVSGRELARVQGIASQQAGKYGVMV
jgi:tape measure domain-containing protein